MKVRRRRMGATLGLVAICVLVLVVVGVGVFFLSKILGGGREMANATDSGALNIAKQAIRNPNKDAFAFPNPDVGRNFALLGDGSSKLDLLVYNRLVAHAAMVALNAKDEGTAQSASNAKRTWSALNDVGTYLRQKLEDQAYMAADFTNLANANNIKMLGNNQIAMTNFGVAYMKAGRSTNVYIAPSVLATFGSGGQVPMDTAGSGASVPGNPKYMAGYKPFTVSLPSGDNLTFSGVPVFPSQNPHLVSYGDWNPVTKDVVAGSGSPAYPADTLPPNSFKSSGQTVESKTNILTGALACSIVGCSTAMFSGNFPYGYITIKNGPSAPGPIGPRALIGPSPNVANDIFAAELMTSGIFINNAGGGQFFSTNGPTNSPPGAFQPWADYNANPCASYDPITGNCTSQKPQPSTAGIFKADGTPASAADLASINNGSANKCFYTDYGLPMKPGKQDCLTLLPSFKKAYNKPGTPDNGNVAPGGFTDLEQVNTDMLSNRYSAMNLCDMNYCQVTPRNTPSGVKWFDHTLPTDYQVPTKAPYNFEVVKSPLEYLQMIDQGSYPNNCAMVATLNGIIQRCQQIVPGISAASVQTVLRSQPLPLGGTLYVYATGGNLLMTTSPPPWMVPGTAADGTPTPCGKPYQVGGRNLVDEGLDGSFGYPFATSPAITCQDIALWTPSTGFNNFLGELDFSDLCTSDGQPFGEPN